jgi:hypothetical protein
MQPDRWLCGWRVRSDVSLPELPVWNEDDRAPDVTVSVGAVPDDLGPLSNRTRRLLAAEDGRVRLGVEGSAAYLVDADGRHVTLDPAPHADEAELRLYLLGSVFSILCYKRGLLPLHASAVRIGDRILSLSGDSGAGKSTLAAAMVASGHALAADDVTAVDLSTGAAIARPAFPRVRLSREAIAGLAMEPPDHAPERADAKHSCAVSSFAASPAPLDAVYLLRRRPDTDSWRIETLGGLAAAQALSRALYRPKIGAAIAGSDAIFSAVTRLAAAVPVHVLEYGAGFGVLPRVASALDHRQRAGSL